jgi:hypothetical protein
MAHSAADSARTQFLREPSGQQVACIAAKFAAIATAVIQRRPDPELQDTLEQTQAFCGWAAAGAPSGELKALLPNLKTALETWRQVWPRLGAQREFRQAVAREADLWSRRLQALAKQA